MKRQQPRPGTIFGVLAPGEQTTRPTSQPIPKDHIPIVQNLPNGNVQLIEFSDSSVTIANRGDRTATFFIHFLSQAAFDTIHAAKNLLDKMIGLRKARNGDNANNS